jgi:hypothetical protein
MVGGLCMISNINKKYFKPKAGKKTTIIVLLFLLSTSITFGPSVKGQAALIIVAPSEVYEHIEFEVTVLSSDGGMPIRNAIVTFAGDPYITNSNGKAYPTAPDVEQDTTYTIIATKKDYLNDTVNITVLDTAVTEELAIIAPQEIDEGERFEIKVETADEELPVENVLVTVEWNEYNYYTNSYGIAALTAPSVIETIDYIITANKAGYQQVSTSITVRDTGVPTVKQLEIDAPSSVVEGASFQVTVTADDEPISNVTVEFLDEEYNTDNNGAATIEAPDVELDTDYIIVGSKDGFLPDEVSITVLNQITEGWVYGIVSNNSGNPIRYAKVCVLISNYTTKCVLTNDQGIYTILIPSGTYSIEASKQMYETSTKSGIIIGESQAIEVNFILQEIHDYDHGSYVDESRDSIEVAIDLGTEAGKIGGEVNIRPADEDYSIKVYKEINVTVVSIEEDVFSVKVNANDIPGTVLAFRIIGHNEAEIAVEYDGASIERISFSNIFNLVNTSSNAKYTRILAEAEDGDYVMYCLLWIPEFSEHEITIYTIEEVIETIAGITALALYIAIIVVLAIITAIPVIRLWRKIE